jgi:hypothetical protein
MTDTILLLENIDTIAPVTPEQSRAYDEAVREAQEDAAIILAIARHKLSGPEIYGLESEAIDGTVLLRLQTEFAREIADYKKGVRS